MGGGLIFSAAARVGLVEKLCGLINKGEGGQSNTSLGDDSLECTNDGSMVVFAAVWTGNCSPVIMGPAVELSHRFAAQTGGCR
jgi:hypothetical protein